MNVEAEPGLSRGATDGQRHGRAAFAHAGLSGQKGEGSARNVKIPRKRQSFGRLVIAAFARGTEMKPLASCDDTRKRFGAVATRLMRQCPSVDAVVQRQSLQVLGDTQRCTARGFFPHDIEVVV